VAATDAYQWGYDPVHWGVPEGSYATDPDGPIRILEFRCVVCPTLPFLRAYLVTGTFPRAGTPDPDIPSHLGVAMRGLPNTGPATVRLPCPFPALLCLGQDTHNAHRRRSWISCCNVCPVKELQKAVATTAATAGACMQK
jgi:hypothetical protein